ncbi:uncharacterized protein FOMMEDRAFT_112684 [Fomitiporia mediterranea MF3/22]|uniref:uncharacterized protein n=1 Tax=Fomitiporia mediterranea (strain MF3/22) TaxID=694068 RepID=UPI00044091F9|nr:uncharacterized protein FOMMEDRAFT_112684 [Fomitiporia mediterranea MF3/22]EJC99615.1 hypothetical protein FOMMEDRAFT_112684 [Fomitiporia mediterranea MF3/22]
MSSAQPATDLWLERSRLDGMILGAVSYGFYALLTIQATSAILHKSRGNDDKKKKIALLSYVAITFVLATIGFAGNVKYTQMIWVDLRNAPGGPDALIDLELDYWINRMALASYYIMEWVMEILLLYRCFVIWRWKPYIVLPMSALFLASVAMSILVLTESIGAVFYNIKVQLAYLCIAVGTNIIYTILVVARLVAVRNQVRETLGAEHAETYVSIAAMVVESAAMYSALGVIYIVAFSVHSNVSNLVFLSISHVQGIAQLFIILRVAHNRAYSDRITTRTSEPTTLAFASHSVHHATLPNMHSSSESSDAIATVAEKKNLDEKQLSSAEASDQALAQV